MIKATDHNPFCPHERTKKHGVTKSGEQRYRCLDCGKTFVDSTRTLDGMRIGTEQAVQILQLMMEGMAVRSIARVTGVEKKTILALLVLVGGRCKKYMEENIVNVPVSEVQCDELWSFLYCKERTRKRLSLPIASFGDQYCFYAIDRHHKLTLAWQTGVRDYANGRTFIQKLSRACEGTDFQVNTDGWMPYGLLIPQYMGAVDYAMIIKYFAESHHAGQYSPPQIIRTRIKPVCGNPDLHRTSTSHVERANLSLRMCLRRFSRLTLSFSRKVENHEAALGLYFAHYNYVARHGTLKTSPAVAAGIASERWTMAELIERTRDYEPELPTHWLERRFPNAD